MDDHVEPPPCSTPISSSQLGHSKKTKTKPSYPSTHGKQGEPLLPFFLCLCLWIQACLLAYVTRQCQAHDHADRPIIPPSIICHHSCAFLPVINPPRHLSTARFLWCDSSGSNTRFVLERPEGPSDPAFTPLFFFFSEISTVPRAVHHDRLKDPPGLDRRTQVVSSSHDNKNSSSNRCSYLAHAPLWEDITLATAYLGLSSAV